MAPVIAAVAEAMTTIATQAADDVVTEAAEQGVTIGAGSADTDRIHEAASAVVATIIAGYASSASRTALLLAGPAATAAAIGAAVTVGLNALTSSGDTGFVSKSLGSALSLAQHEGRMATVDAAEVAPELIASEILDAAICDPCEEIDGTVFADRAAAEAAYPTGRYRECLGADRCRGQIITRWTKVGDS
jgi:hypothetical protein